MPSATRDRLLQHLLARPFDQSVVLLFSALAVIFIAPFGLFRALTGHWAHAGADLLVALIALAIGLFVWRTGRTQGAAPALVALFSITFVALVYLSGPSMLFWAYPVTTAAFFLLGPASAVRVNLATFLVILPQALLLGSWSQFAGFAGPLAANGVLAMVFAAGMRQSRTHLRLMAEQDALTGTGNRQALEPALIAALRKRIEQQTPMSLIALDLDHFKHVNDRYGHEAGDRVLIEVATLIKQSVRAGDNVFRYGGEELVIIASGAGATASGRIAEKIRKRIRSTPMPGIGYVSVSGGVAEARESDDPASWFRRSDELLYQAKSDGRNRICVESPQAA